MSDDSGADAQEMYHDVVKNEPRRRRGKRKRPSRGPYSAEEAAMIDAFDKMLATERYMHGALAQMTCRDITVILVRLRRLCEDYSYENTGRDISGIDPHVIAKELDLLTEESAVSDDVDIYQGLE